MLTHNINITTQLQNILHIQLGKLNTLPSGQSIYRITHSSSLEQGDESAIHTYTITGNLNSNATDADYEQETEFCNQFRQLNPNDLFSDPEDSDSIDAFTQAQIPGGFLNLWRTRNNDTFIMQETDNTFYITIIESGQY